MIDKTIEEVAWNFARKQWGKQISHTLDKIADMRIDHEEHYYSLHGECKFEPDEEPKPAEPEEEYRNILQDSANCDKWFDNILKDSFREHNKLYIATQIVAAIYSNHQAAKGFKSIEEIVRKSLDIANTLIKESEKEGSEHGED